MVVIVLVASMVVLATGLWGWYLAQPGPLGAPTTVVIQSGKSLGWIAERLDRANVIAGARRFKLATRVMLLDSSLQAGEYRFEPGMSLRTVINKLATGDVAPRQITIPEGTRSRDIARILAAEESLTGDVPAVQEGALFPSTYHVQHGQTRASVVAKMERQMAQHVAKVWENRDILLPFATPDELVSLASIVEKETSLTHEMPTVAAVFINRLKQGMKLQADPTVIYGASNYNGNLTTMHLRENQPYNTYVHKGLPPTPIANPGLAALQATARPAAVDYLYFVADGTGGHVFAHTYEEHLINVKNYVETYRQQHGG